MPTLVTTPPTGVKLSEKPTVTDLSGVVLAGLRPKAGEPGKFENIKVDAQVFALPGPNLRPDAEKRVKWRTQAESDAEGYNASSLEALPASGLCLGTEAVVEFYNLPGQPNRHHVRLALRYDQDPTSLPDNLRSTAYVDGDFTGNPLPGVWMEVGSAAEAALSVRRYDAVITDWRLDETVKILFAGDSADSFFTLLQAGGPFPAPQKGVTDATYRPAAAPRAQASAFADLLGEPADNPALQAVFTAFGNATAVQRQRLDAILAGTDSSVDTFIEAYNRFVADESAAAVLNGQVSSLQTVQGQHTQQIGTNTSSLALLAARVFGRNRGPWAASTAYLQYDFVTYQGVQYYANQAFTSGASFNAANWTQGAYSSVSNLPFASTTQAGVVKLNSSSSGGIRVSGTSGVLRNEALYYTRDTVYPAYTGSEEAQVGFGFTCAVNGHPQVSINTSAGITGDVLAIRNLGTQSTKINANGFTLDGQADLSLEPGGWIVLKKEDTNISTVERGSLSASGSSAASQLLTATYTASQAGAQTITQAGATAFFDVGWRTTGGQVYALSQGTGYTVSGSTLTILAAVGVQAGQVIEYAYLTGAAPGAGGGGSGPTYTAGNGIAISGQNVISATNGRTVFTGYSGNFQVAAGIYPGNAVNQFIFAPIQNITLDFYGGWNPATNRWKPGRKGTYRFDIELKPEESSFGHGTYEALGWNFFAGVSVSTPADVPGQGKWGLVSQSQSGATRQSITLSITLDLSATDEVGMDYFTEKSMYILNSLKVTETYNG